jgi:tetratricopeptide (TPR) repeat protein
MDGKMKKLIAPLGMMIIVALSVAGCGTKTDLAIRYEMEKKLNETDKLQDQFGIGGNGLSEDNINTLAKAYLKIADMVKLPKDSTEVIKASPEKLQTWELAMLAYTRVGVLYFDRKNDYDKAYDYFNIILNTPSAKPVQRGAALNYMAACRENAGKFEEAAKLYNQLAAGYPEYIVPENPNIDALNAPIKAAEMWQKMGNDAKYREKLDAARGYYNKLLPKYPDTPFAAAVQGKIVGTYLREGKFEQAISMLEDTRDKKTKLLSPRVLMIMADIFMNNLKDYRRGERTYREYVKNYPDQNEIAPMTLGLGLSLYQQGKYSQAREAIKDIEKLPNTKTNTVVEAYYLTALCYEEEGQWERAIGQFDLVQATFPGSDKAFEAGLHVANYYQEHGQTKLAQQKFAETAEYISRYTNPETSNPAIAARALGYLARCYSEARDINKTLETLETLYNRYPKSQEGALAPLKLADLYENELKNNTKAISWLRIFIDANPKADTLTLHNHIKDLEKK